MSHRIDNYYDNYYNQHHNDYFYHLIDNYYNNDYYFYNNHTYYDYHFNNNAGNYYINVSRLNLKYFFIIYTVIRRALIIMLGMKILEIKFETELSEG